MKSIVTSIAASSLLAVLALAQPARPPRYTVTDLGTLPGGTFSQPFFINNNGLVSGGATGSNGNQHAVLWQKGLITDLGTLQKGPNSITFGDNESGQAVGETEISTADPNGEDFCGFGTHLICLPFLWQHGVMTALPTLLGGNNGVANLINNRGEVAGDSEIASVDPTCPAPQVRQFKPVIWENGKVRELPTFPGDLEGVAFGINDNGQVVGASGDCAAFNSNLLVNLTPVHALLWQKENGIVTDLGNLGGKNCPPQCAGGNLALNVNNRGQVVGNSDLPGDTTFHGFLWTRETGMQDLGTLPGDFASIAIALNDQGDVVGVSLDANFNPRAFLRQNGVMTDLNTLISANSPLSLMTGCSINSRGEIVGLAMQKSTGQIHTYLATPSKCAGAPGCS
jgi:probable HAF family extracellular repeat protein